MITNKVIDSIYKKYSKRPKSTDDLNIALLFENLDPAHGIVVDGDNLIINSISSTSPFHELMLKCIHAVVELDRHIAIVLHSSILFLDKESDGVHIHIKKMNDSFASKLSALFARS